MPPRKRYAIVFVHGLAKKPAPEKLEEIWQWGLTRDDPRGDVFPNPNPGIDLNEEGVPAIFNYYADVFYGTEYETEFGSYYESNADAANETEVPPENISKVAGEITRTIVAAQVSDVKYLEWQERMQMSTYKPGDVGLPTYMDSQCAITACTLPVVTWAGYTTLGQGAPSGFTVQNAQERSLLSELHAGDELTVALAADRTGVDASKA